MVSTSSSFDSEHPLLADRTRLDEIADVMYAKIHKVLFGWSTRRPQGGADRTGETDGWERTVSGSGESADDVLAEALIALLKFPADRLDDTWEGLAVTIAHHKAVDAWRAAQKGLSGTDHRPPLHLVSGDTERQGPDGETEPSLFEVLPATWGDPEAEYFELRGVLDLRNLAREILDDRERQVFFAIHFDDRTRREVGEQLGLTGQRIGQIYHAACQRLAAHPYYARELQQPGERGN